MDRWYLRSGSVWTLRRVLSIWCHGAHKLATGAQGSESAVSRTIESDKRWVRLLMLFATSDRWARWIRRPQTGRMQQARAVP